MIEMKMTKQIGTLLIVFLLITAIISSPEIHYKVKRETLYYCIPLENDDREQHSHPAEVEVVAVSDLAGTYYGEAIGAEFI